jgi:O-antigen/teichoic acid export membrane protein
LKYMRQSLRIIWNAFTNNARVIILMLVALVLNPFLFHRLGEDAYGVIALANATTGFFFLLDIGMAHAVTRFVSRYAAVDDLDKLSEVVSTALAVYLVLGLLVFSVVGALAMFLLAELGVPETVRPEARWMIGLVGLGLGVRFACYAFEGTLRGLQRFDLCNLAAVGERLAYALGALLVVGVWQRGLVTLGICLFGSIVAANVARFVSLYLVCPGLQVRARLVSSAILKEMLGFGGFAALTQVSSFMEKTGTQFVISAVLGSTVLGFYSLLMVVVALQMRMAVATNTVVMPVASRLETLRETEKLTELVLLGSRGVLTMVVPCAVWMMVMAEPLLLTWVGPSLAVYAPLLVGLAAVELLDLIGGVGNMVLLGMGKARNVGLTYISTSILVMVVLIVLLSMTSLGLFSVVWAWLFGVVIRRTVILLYLCRVLQMTWWLYLRGVLLPVGVTGLVTALSLWVLRQVLPVPSWWSILTSIAVGGTVHLAVSSVVVLTGKERQRLITELGKWYRRYAGRKASCTDSVQKES